MRPGFSVAATTPDGDGLRIIPTAELAARQQAYRAGLESTLAGQRAAAARARPPMSRAEKIAAQRLLFSNYPHGRR